MTDLSVLDVAIGGTLVLLAAGLSALSKLGISGAFLVSGARMVAQLCLMALVLRWLFGLSSPLAVLAAMVVMGAFAGLEVVLRHARLPGRVWATVTGGGLILTIGLVVSVPAVVLLIEADPWFAPQVMLPLFGMIAGSALTAVALTWTTFIEAAHRDRAIIEARLSLGAPFPQAISTIRRHAAKTGLMPTVNAMGAIGLVHFPGVMTGQLLAGADPLQAVKYQLLIMFLIAGATALSVVAAAYAMTRRLTDTRHRLRLDRLG
ncbi:MAG: ABC transporter permease [Pseudomonadota bacterium]